MTLCRQVACSSYRTYLTHRTYCLAIIKLLFQRHLHHLGAIHNIKLALIVKDHSGSMTVVRFEYVEIATIAVEHLNTFHIGNENSTLAINSNRDRRLQLSRLVARTSKLINVFSIPTKFEDGIIEPAQCINISQAILCMIFPAYAASTLVKWRREPPRKHRPA